MKAKKIIKYIKRKRGARKIRKVLEYKQKNPLPDMFKVFATRSCSDEELSEEELGIRKRLGL